MGLHDLILILFAFISEFIGTLTGFGSSTLFLPLATYIESFQLVLALTAILHCFGNTSRILIFKNQFNLSLFVKLGLPSIALAGLGAHFTSYANPEHLQRALGAVLVPLSLVLFFQKKNHRKMPEWAAVTLSGLSGLVTGFVGTGGAIRGIALMALNLEKNVFVVLSASIDIGGDLLRTIIYLRNGYMDWSQWFYLPLLGIAAFVGARVGKRVLNHINQTRFDRIVAFFIFLSGMAMLMKVG